MKAITTTQALKNADNFKTWEHDLISDTEYRKLRTKAKRAFNNYFKHSKDFELESCWITSGDLHGFYFPNINGKIRAVIFENNETSTAVLLLKDEN